MADSWHAEFFHRHCERFPRGDWPEASSGFWQDWRRKLAKAGVRQAEATAASEAMFDSGLIPMHVSDHPDALQGQVKAAWRQWPEATSPDLPDPGEIAGALWDRAAAENWATLPEADRDEARQMVRERLPELSRHPIWLERLAMGWAHDPRMAAGLPPKRAPSIPPAAPNARRGPKPVGQPRQPDPILDPNLKKGY